MVWIRRLLKSEFFIRIISFFAACYIRLVYWTCQWQVIGKEIPESYHQANKPFVVCFWHGRLGMLACAWTWKTRPFRMLLSSHKDGRLIGQTVAHFGIKGIWGSTRRGGTQALRDMLKYLRDGDTIGITPDGPRGPHQVASPGTIILSRLGNVDLIPITFSTSRRIQLKSWDHFHLPLPFGKGVFIWGKPIHPPLDRNDIHLRSKLEQLETEMTALQNQADCLMGISPK